MQHYRQDKEEEAIIEPSGISTRSCRRDRAEVFADAGGSYKGSNAMESNSTPRRNQPDPQVLQLMFGGTFFLFVP
jgi:hypothetical protein